LTSNAEDLRWIAKIGFALDRLSTQAIIGLILKEAGFRWFHLGTATGRIQVKLAAHDGESFSDVAFGCSADVVKVASSSRSTSRTGNACEGPTVARFCDFSPRTNGGLR
jgi:hypothetical protein